MGGGGFHSGGGGLHSGGGGFHSGGGGGGFHSHGFGFRSSFYYPAIYGGYYDPWYGGYLGQEADDPINRQNKNNYELFSVGGLDFLVIHVELDWPDYSVAWADKIIKRYPNRRVILSSHAFLNTSNARPTAAQFRSNGTSAEAVWQQIIKPNCNVFMVINGHYPGEGRRTDLNNCGQPVHQVLMDYQDRANGGDGWLLSGQKHFGSGSGVTSFMLTSARPDGEQEPDWFVIEVAGVPWDGSAGMRLTAEWDGDPPRLNASRACDSVRRRAR